MSLTKAVPHMYEVRDVLKRCWSKETAYTQSLTVGKQTPSRGQCFVTALLIKKLFGGDLMTGMINDEKHYWNIINGVEIDFTSDQYGGDGYHPVTNGKISKAKGRLNKRYIKLVKIYNKLSG